MEDNQGLLTAIGLLSLLGLGISVFPRPELSLESYEDPRWLSSPRGRERMEISLVNNSRHHAYVKSVEQIRPYAELLGIGQDRIQLFKSVGASRVIIPPGGRYIVGRVEAETNFSSPTYVVKFRSRLTRLFGLSKTVSLSWDRRRQASSSSSITRRSEIAYRLDRVLRSTRMYSLSRINKAFTALERPIPNSSYYVAFTAQGKQWQLELAQWSDSPHVQQTYEFITNVNVKRWLSDLSSTWSETSDLKKRDMAWQLSREEFLDLRTKVRGSLGREYLRAKYDTSNLQSQLKITPSEFFYRHELSRDNVNDEWKAFGTSSEYGQRLQLYGMLRHSHTPTVQVFDMNSLVDPVIKVDAASIVEDPEGLLITQQESNGDWEQLFVGRYGVLIHKELSADGTYSHIRSSRCNTKVRNDIRAVLFSILPPGTIGEYWVGQHCTSS